MGHWEHRPLIVLSRKLLTALALRWLLHSNVISLNLTAQYFMARHGRDTLALGHSVCIWLDVSSGLEDMELPALPVVIEFIILYS